MTIAPQPQAAVESVSPTSFPIRRPYLFALLLILIQVVVGAVAGGIFGISGNASYLNTLIFWFSTSAALALITALLVTRLRWWRRIGFRASSRRTRDLLLCLPLCLILAWNVSQIDNAAIVQPMQIVGLLLLTLLAAFVEESIYRGLMLRALEARGIWHAALVSALLFGLMHLPSAIAGSNLAMTAGQVVYATAIGFAYATYALRTGLIWPLILVHALANLAELIDQETIFSTTPPTDVDLIRWPLYVIAFAAYGTLMLRTITKETCPAPNSFE